MRVDWCVTPLCGSRSVVWFRSRIKNTHSHTLSPISPGDAVRGSIYFLSAPSLPKGSSQVLIAILGPLAQLESSSG